MDTTAEAEVKDAEDTAPIGRYTPSKEEEALITKWKGRMDVAKKFRRPYSDKWLRMYYLYRAYRNKKNYAYNTNIMPAIGFEIIETVKPRLASARMQTRILPTKREDIGSPALENWGDLLNYNFEAMDFEDKKIDWIQASLNFGDGFFAMHWDGVEQRPEGEVLDNWLLYFDPNAGPRLKNSGWEIKQIFKKKKRILDSEKKRGDNSLYKNTQWLEENAISDDPRSERFRIETLKMAQIDGPTRNTGETGASQTSQTDEKSQDKMVELWECYDHEENTLVTLGNKGEIVLRNEDTPYENVNDGRLIVPLPCIKIPWSAYSMSILEPVETTIHELADSRNQAMDDIVFSLDPIRKVRKDAGITNDDIKYTPGAMWELKRADDVVVERGPEISKSWIEKDNLLRNEIQSNLALSEYTRGIPQNGTEPSSKVELLLMQSNIRFSQFVRQLKTAITDIANICIEMNREFLTEDKAYRLLGEELNFKDFTDADRDVKVDADVEIEVVPEKTREQEKSETLELYKIFIAEDKPNPNDPEDMKRWTARKRIFQEMILEDYGKEKYAQAILGTLKQAEEVEKEVQEQAPEEAPGAPAAPVPGGNAPMSAIPQPVPMVPPEELSAVVPSAQDMPGAQAGPGILARLLGRGRQLNNPQ